MKIITSNMGLCLHLALWHMGRFPKFRSCDVSHVPMSSNYYDKYKNIQEPPSLDMHDLEQLFYTLFFLFLGKKKQFILVSVYEKKNTGLVSYLICMYIFV